MYHDGVEDVTAFILAGGKSSRMGEDKAFLALAGETLLARALTTARLITPCVQIVGDPEKFAGYGRVIADIFPGRGPLGGIHAALMNTSRDLNLVMAVDTPFIPHTLLAFLIARAENSEAIVTVPHSGGRLHPLCAVYRREFSRICEQSLLLGHNKIDSLFVGVEAAVVEEEELLNSGFRPEIFRNLNTPDDWQQAQMLYGLPETIKT